MKFHATLVRTDDSDDESPVEYSVQVPAQNQTHGHDVSTLGGLRQLRMNLRVVEIGRVWLDGVTDEWVAIPASQTRPILGRWKRVLDAVTALLDDYATQPR